MQNIKTFIIEKLKIAPRNGIKTTVAKFVGWYKGIQWFRVNRYDIEEMPFSKNLQGEFGSAHNAAEFLYKHLNDEIIVDETLSVELNRHCKLYEYHFDLDGKEFIFDARIYDDSELLSNATEYIEEKLKISKNLINNVKEIRCELRNFVTWYMYDDSDWDESDLKTVEFARNTTESYFGGSYKKLYEFICKHEQDIIDVREYADTYGNYYAYEFTIEDIPFKVEAYIENPSDLLSKQWRILVEKLKVSSNYSGFEYKCKVKDFFLWYWNYPKPDDDFWDAMDQIGFDNDVIETEFDDNFNNFMDWFIRHFECTMYFNEKVLHRDTVEYTFDIDGKEFKLYAYSDDSNMSKFTKAKSNCILESTLTEKLKVSTKPKVINCTVRQLFKNEFDRKFNYNDLVGFFTDVRKEHFDDNVYDMIDFLKEHANDKIEVTREIEDIIDGFGEVVRYSFTLDGIEFTDIIIVEYVTEKLKVSSNTKPDVIDCTVKQFMDWFWRDKDSKYTGEDLELFQFGGDAILQISPTMNDYDKMYIFLKWREDEDIEVTEQIESGRSQKLKTDWQYGIYTFTLDGVAFDVTAPFSSDEDPFSVYYEKLMEIEL